jgi:hypothetical protein
MVMQPFLFYLWDRNSYGYAGAVLYPAIMMSNALLAISLFGILAVRRKLDLALKILFASIVVLLFFSICNFENLTWQKQIHEILCLTLLSFGLLVAATVSIGTDNDRSAPADVALVLVSGLFCLAATYSFGFGLAAWPAVLVHGLLTRWRWLPLLTFAAIAGFTIVTYALTYTVLPYHTNPAEAAREPLRLAIYVLYLIGSVIQFNPTGAAVAAAPAAILSIVVMLRFYLSPAARPASRIGRLVASHAAMLIIASLCMAAMVALGRLTVNSGTDSRYVVVSSLFWWPAASGLGHRRPRPRLQAYRPCRLAPRNRRQGQRNAERTRVREPTERRFPHNPSTPAMRRAWGPGPRRGNQTSVFDH